MTSKAMLLFFTALLIVFFAVSPVHVCAGEVMNTHGASVSMELHHMHVLLSHGLLMVTEGSDMAMLAEMKMVPSMDQMTLEHGRHMMKSGKEVIEHVMNGPEMKSLHKGGHADDPLMKYTHQLGEAMMKVTDILENMSIKGPLNADMMTMHHMHIMINHALGMAAQGSSLIMLGQMGMADDIDKYSVEHGRMMLKDAHALLDEVFGGKAMKEMHEKGMKMDNTMMADTHKLGEAAAKVIDLLEKMPNTKEG
jgi:hypothetical protein